MSERSRSPVEPSAAARARWTRAQELFAAALEVSQAERPALLDRECRGDPGLQRDVESLLAAHERSGPLDRLADAVLGPAVARVRAVPEGIEGRLISHYVIRETLGTGGMGVVYRADDERLGRPIALKFLPPHLGTNEDAKRRFILEARAAAALEHPNVCTIHEIGETPEGQLFIAMPLYEGETLQARLARGPLPIDEAVGIAREIALGLAAAHRLGIVHRDVKPSNVMLLPEGRLKILDFGVAKVQDITMTGSGTRLGTAAYMSPEQARGEAVDVRTDVWALGVVLYEMLAGRRPFQEDTSAALLYTILTSAPPSLTDVRSDVPRALADLVAAALTKTAARRIGSMTELLAALEATVRRTDSVEDASPASSTAERRHVALLATTVCDYASLVEQLDSTELEDIMGRVRSEAVDVVRRHGGLVNQAIGEDIVALFGIPAGHEDDELRAVRAALELQTRVRAIATGATRQAGSSIAVQSGIDSGSTVVQRLREGPRRYNVSGETVQIARRLAGLAGRDAVWISPECHRVVAPFVSSEPGRSIDLRPGAPPAAPYRVLGDSGLQTRLEAAERAHLTPYAGRTAELSRLERVVDRARAGEGRLVVVVGEAGMGKSRLLYELSERVRASGVNVLKGRCQSYGGLSPYLPFVQILGDALGIGPSGGRAAADVAERIRTLDASLDAFVPLYLHLLSLQSEQVALPRHLQGEHLHAALLDAVTAIVMVLARRSPLLVLLEDWHWADEASRDVVQRLADILEASAIAVVVTSRPEGAGIAELGAQTDVVHLGPLGRQDSIAIMRAMFQVRRVSDDLAVRVHERTGGNPFFLEQMARTLSEEGAVTTACEVAEVQRDVERLRLPDTVQAVIRARLDRLDADTRELLRVASVIGREFGRTLLAAALDPQIEPLRALERARASGLIQQTHVIPEPTYRFKHVLTHEVAYGSLLEHQRRTLHGLIGRAMERENGERLDQFAEKLAHHFSLAESWAEAIRYGRHAVERLRSLSQYGDALTMLERVQRWLPNLAGDEEARRELTADILLDEERLCETLGQRGRQQQIISGLIALLAPYGSSPRLAEAYLRQGDVLTLLKRFDAADRALGTVLRLSREQGDAALERNAFRSLGLLRWHEGRHQEALELAEHALAIDRARLDHAAVSGDLANVGNILLSLGEYDRARTVLEEALSMPVVADEPLRVHYILHNLANVHRAIGEPDVALAYLQRGSDMPLDLPIQRSFHLISIAHIRLQQGLLDDALRIYAEAVALSRRARYADGLAQSLRSLGELQLGLGQDREAIAHLSEAAGLFAQLEDRSAEAQAWGHVAALHERGADWDQARRAWQSARALAQALDDRHGELDALEGIARTSRRLQAPAPAILAGFEEALALAVALGEREREASLHNTLGILAWERECYPEALAHYEMGLRLWRRLGHRPHEGLMLNSVGVTLARLQRYEEARTALEESADLNRAIGERLLEAHALAVLGDVSLRLGRRPEARACYERARDLRHQLGDRAGEETLARRLTDIRETLSNEGE